MNFQQTRAAERVYRQNMEKAFSNLLHMLANEELPSEDIPVMLEYFGNDPQFKELSNMAASRMVTAQKNENARSWRAAAAKGTRGRTIYSALKQEATAGLDGYIQSLILQNSELIRSLPRDTARDVNQKILQWTMEGLRHEEIAKRLREMVPRDIKTNLRLIARTELSKCNSAITEARSLELDIHWYTWLSANDGERVRPSHQNMHGVLVPWDSAPNPEVLNGEKNAFGRYHAGCCPNCRCYSEPVVAPELLPDSFRVYIGGEIRRITRAQFIEMAA